MGTTGYVFCWPAANLSFSLSASKSLGKKCSETSFDSFGLDPAVDVVVGVEARVVIVPPPSENLLVLFEMNDPIPLPHPLNVFAALSANSEAPI